MPQLNPAAELPAAHAARLSDPRTTTAPGTVTVFSDIWCSFAHAGLYRLHRTRERLGLADRVLIDHRAFPLEMFNGGPSPRRGTDSEVGGIARIEPDAGWQMWRAEDWRFPSTSLFALEAVQLAKEQGLRASERLDLALRRAFWAHSRPVGSRSEVIAIARETSGVSEELIEQGLDDGRARRLVTLDFECARRHEVRCSPHAFVSGGAEWANPGIEATWHGSYGTGFPEVTGDEPDAWEAVLRAAADTSSPSVTPPVPHT
ncbi:DsbA family oxidoreductase [Streptomyces endophyticus]|uniref:DsbA family protein n=1 Tax=Streptomyces endophyticus TaxID=714166 RepID=A0ABU6EXN3_9ACTN|nr:DsbA family protein [Streptomyces endophyticus]MEB8336520.1 DsbA family protein [Streptomyces endophyticus]